jgi:hypothetical protein
LKLHDLHHVPDTALPEAYTLYRVQRVATRPGTRRVGALRLAPAGLLASRFDVPKAVVGYFGEGPDTALYESMARREATSLSLAMLAGRQLMAMQSTRTLRLADLRPHVSSWPFLQALRYAQTQAVAADALRLGFEGLMYRSAQHYGRDCIALFEPCLADLKLVWRAPLINDAGGLHRAAAQAIEGSQIPVVP